MIVAPLVGGLSNQLVIYAAAKALSLKNNDKLYLDLNYFDRKTAVKYRLDELYVIEDKVSNMTLLFKFGLYRFGFSRHLKWILTKMFTGRNVYVEAGLEFDESFFSLKGDLYLKGNFISCKYYQSIIKELKIYCKPKLISKSAETLIQKLSQEDSVSLHIRRGDYVTNKNAYNFHGVLGKKYYQKAVEYILKAFKKPKFYIFSDDIEYVKREFEFLSELDVFFVSEVDGLSDTDEFELMKYVKFNVIANSGFSRWSALLNYNNSKVIMPDKWFKATKTETTDLGLDSWIRICSDFAADENVV
jgi:hypothetical protein